MEPGTDANSGGGREAQKGREIGLQEVLTGIERVGLSGVAKPKILSLACDSRKVMPGALFFALPGQKADGNRFVREAIMRGAVAIASGDPRTAEMGAETAWVQIPTGTERRALAIAAANYYGRPANALKLIGVTGTNGKTTTTFLVDSILHAAGFTTGRIGTTGYETPRGIRAAVNTTPESLDLQEMFAEVRDAGGTHAVLEVSSHSLAMGMPLRGRDFY